MNDARLAPVKVAALAFPVFFLGGLAFSLHGGPCTGQCHTSVFWPTALGGPLAVGFLSAALQRVPGAATTDTHASAEAESRWATLRRIAGSRG